MADITIRDLCRWDRRLTLVPPAGVAPEVVLDRAISWAVSVRATPPLLPPLRGDELVVLPMRVLEQIESGETLSREALMETLTRQRIAAILTEPAFTEEPIEAIPVLVLPSPFPHDVEGGINRIITERRAELYRLGNELSRRLSESVLDPRGLEALLRTASELSGRSLILQDADGNVVAASQIDDIPPASVEALLSARRAVGPVLVPEPGGTERLITTLSTGGQAGYLSTAGAAGTLTETDRLVLTQTAGTCSIVLSQQNRAVPSARSGRERLVADLLLGRLASDAATMARGQMLGIDPAAPVTVGLIETPDGPATARDLVIQALGKAAGDNVATIHDALGFILPHDGSEQASQAFRRVLAQPRYDGVSVALSRPLTNVTQLPNGVREALFALGLRRTGALTKPVIDCLSIDDLGLYTLFYPLWGDPTIERFRDAALGPLEAYDRRRGSCLVETLEAYLTCGGSLAEAAEHLHIHRNTLSYRLQRIATLTKRDLANPQDRLLLQTALLTRRLPPLPDLPH